MGPHEGLGPDIVEGVRRIKSQDGPGLVLSGSSTLTSTLLEHGLADEVLLIVYPVLLGTGKHLFAEGTPAQSFEFAGTTTTPTGVMVSTYKDQALAALVGLARAAILRTLEIPRTTTELGRRAGTSVTSASGTRPSCARRA